MRVPSRVRLLHSERPRLRPLPSPHFRGPSEQPELRSGQFPEFRRRVAPVAHRFHFQDASHGDRRGRHPARPPARSGQSPAAAGRPGQSAGSAGLPQPSLHLQPVVPAPVPASRPVQRPEPAALPRRIAARPADSRPVSHRHFARPAGNYFEPAPRHPRLSRQPVRLRPPFSQHSPQLEQPSAARPKQRLPSPSRPPPARPARLARPRFQHCQPVSRPPDFPHCLPAPLRTPRLSAQPVQLAQPFRPTGLPAPRLSMPAGSAGFANFARSPADSAPPAVRAPRLSAQLQRLSSPAPSPRRIASQPPRCRPASRRHFVRPASMPPAPAVPKRRLRSPFPQPLQPSRQLAARTAPPPQDSKLPPFSPRLPRLFQPPWPHPSPPPQRYQRAFPQPHFWRCPHFSPRPSRRRVQPGQLPAPASLPALQSPPDSSPEDPWPARRVRTPPCPPASPPDRASARRSPVHPWKYHSALFA